MKMIFRADDAEQLKTLIASYIADRAEKARSTGKQKIVDQRVQSALAVALGEIATLLHEGQIAPVKTAPTIEVWLS
jgi:hypothetical protein